MINKNDEKKCIIVGAGDFEPMDMNLRHGDLCIAADGGMAYCEKLHLEPDYIIGDFDSVSDSVCEAVKNIEQNDPKRVRRLPTQKDDTDMLAAIRLGLELGYKNFCLYGALGGNRFEHTFANIQCLSFLKQQGAQGCILAPGQKLMLAKDERVFFSAGLKGYISVFAMSERTEGVTLKGLKYELTDGIITSDFPIGVSNEFIGTEAEISVKNGTLLIVITGNC